MSLTFVRNLAKKPDNYFSGHTEPDHVLTAGVTQPRLKRPGAGQPEVIDRKHETGIDQQEVNNQTSSSARVTVRVVFWMLL